VPFIAETLIAVPGDVLGRHQFGLDLRKSSAIRAAKPSSKNDRVSCQSDRIARAGRARWSFRRLHVARPPAGRLASCTTARSPIAGSECRQVGTLPALL